MIKYLGSKRRLVPIIGDLARRVRAQTTLDLFTGTTRVAQEFKRQGTHVWAVDSARYSEVLGNCYIATDADQLDRGELQAALSHLNALGGYEGYFTETFCRRSRYFQPFNGRRVDAIRDAIEAQFRHTAMYPVLLTSLIEAADRVDSTTGVQMAYLKTWAPRSYQALELRPPKLLAGGGVVVRADVTQVACGLPPVDLAYLDPPYNQHSFFANYHVWETLVAWDFPEHYGVACKRADCRDLHTKSPFNSKPQMAGALRAVVTSLRARILILSYNNEAWVTLDDLVDICSSRGEVAVLCFDSRRYVGAQIGVYNPRGARVGRVTHLRNTEYLLISGDADSVAEAIASPEELPRASG